MALQTVIHPAALLAVLASCASGLNAEKVEPNAARAEETRAVFSALSCAYDDARARANPSQVAQVDDEAARIRAMFRLTRAARQCADPLVERLVRCIRISFDGDRVLSEWLSDGACSAPDLARYVN